MRWVHLLVLTSLLDSSSASAGAWTQEQGDFYLKIWDRTLVGQLVYTSDALHFAQRTPRYQDHQLNIYGEVGVHPRLTLVTALTPIGWASIGGESTSYVGPLTVGARVALHRGQLPIAIEAHYGFAPGTGDVIFDEVRVGNDDRPRRLVYEPAIENHRGEIQLQIGRSFRVRQTNAWFAGSVGVRINSHLRHALTGLVQLGFSRRIDWDVHVMLYEPGFQPVEVTNIPGVGDTRYLGFGVGIEIDVHERVAIVASADGIFYAASNAATPALNLGFAVR